VIARMQVEASEGHPRRALPVAQAPPTSSRSTPCRRSPRSASSPAASAPGTADYLALIDTRRARGRRRVLGELSDGDLHALALAADRADGRSGAARLLRPSTSCSAGSSSSISRSRRSRRSACASRS
jgi:hypothetical protein